MGSDVPSDDRLKGLFYPGKRLSYMGDLCTVRYVGPLEATQGEWLGVEWDDEHRGKHDGHHRGVSVFRCLSPSATAASFVKPTRLADCPRTLLEALHSKYTPNVLERNPTTRHEQRIEISGKTVEEIGFDKIMKEQAALEKLRFAVLDKLNIKGIVDDPCLRHRVFEAQVELQRLCPDVIELEISWNLLETWQDLVDIVAAFPQLRVLRACGLRLREVVLNPPDDQMTHSFPLVHELVLDDCHFTADQLDTLLMSSLGCFPALQKLSLSSNDIISLPIKGLSCGPKLSTVTTLMLENNAVDSLVVLRRVLEHFPSLEVLSLQGNQITGLGSEKQSLLAGEHFPIRSLDLSRNQIADFALIDALPRFMSELSMLRLSGNPVYNLVSGDNHAQNPAFYLTVARIPLLTSLNFTTITPRDREEGEIYYLSIAEKAMQALLDQCMQAHENVLATIDTCKQKYPRYHELCTKYDRDAIFTQYLSANATETSMHDRQAYPVGSLGARMVQAYFYMRTASHETHQTTFSHKIPRSIAVYLIKGLVSHHFGLPPLQFKLIYESPELDPVKEIIGDRDDWERWGDWDVDNAIDAALTEGIDKGSEQSGANGFDENGLIFKGGRKWKRREIELLDGWREWGFWLEDGIKEAKVRVEPFEAVNHVPFRP